MSWNDGASVIMRFINPRQQIATHFFFGGSKNLAVDIALDYEYKRGFVTWLEYRA